MIRGGGLIFRLFVVLAMFVAVTVTVTAEDTPVDAEPGSTQAQQETGEEQAKKEAADVVPEFFDPTEEVSEDYAIEFPVDI